MAFSLFGKKPPPKKETPLPKKVEERARTARDSGQGAPRPGVAEPPPSGVGEDLDFTNYVPTPAKVSVPPSPPSAPPSMAPASVAPPDDLGLDFSALPGVAETPKAAPASPVAPKEATAPLSMLSLPSLSQPPVTKAPPPPKESAKKKAAKPIDSILCIEVEEGGGYDIPEVIEQGAILFANGQAEEALARLKTALEKESLGAWKLQVWLMIFDLLQHTGRRAAFEELALQFVVKFERSPPMWVEPPPKAPATAGARPAAANIALSGSLGAQSAGAFEQLKKAAEKQARLKLDFSKVQDIEPEGAKLLLDLFKHLRTAKKDMVLASEQILVKHLRERAKAGDNTVDQAVWALLLEVYQQLGLMNEFEEAAVDFAVTYEVSPPSFDPAAVKAKTVAVSATQQVETQPAPQGGDDDAFRIAGEVAGQHDQLFTDLTAYGHAANPVMVDMNATRRIDFINAGRLLNVLEKLKSQGKPIVIRGAGEMIIALFAVMGIPKVARVIPRK